MHRDRLRAGQPGDGDAVGKATRSVRQADDNAETDETPRNDHFDRSKV